LRFGFLKQLAHFLQDEVSIECRRNEFACGLAMARLQIVEDCGDVRVISCFGLRRGLDQFVGNASHCGNDDHDVARVGRIADDFRHVADARSVADGRTTEFHDGERTAQLLAQRLCDGVRARGSLGKRAMRTLRNRNGVGHRLGNVVMAVATTVSVAAKRVGRCVQRRLFVRARCRFALHFVSVYFVRGTWTDDRACGCFC
jgi:hypothetical protein